MKTVIVTGASGGMGRSIVQSLCETFRVIAVDRNADKLQNLTSLTETDHLVTVQADIGTANWVDALTANIKDNQLYGIINLAGTSCGDSVSNVTNEDWLNSFNVNVTAPMQLIRWAAPYFKHQNQGRVINVGSPVGIVGARKASYASSKAALTGLTMSAARELGQYNTCVNLLLPGPTITDMTQDWSAEKRANIAKGSFLNRLCTPHNIAHTINFLLSEPCDYITGSVIDLTAGSMVGH